MHRTDLLFFFPVFVYSLTVHKVSCGFLCSDYGVFKCPGDTAQEDGIFTDGLPQDLNRLLLFVDGQQHNSLALPEMNLVTACSSLAAIINPLPVQFKALLHGQKGCVFFSGHLNLRTAPETGLPSREKNHNN